MPSTGCVVPPSNECQDRPPEFHSPNSRNNGEIHQEAKELGLLPGEWPKMLCDGEVLTALLLSTSYSEKYKGRKLQPDATAEIILPAPGNQTRKIYPKLLHRAGYREAVAFIWLSGKTMFVAFSPLRFRSQFVKILCAGDVQDGLDLNGQPKKVSWRSPGGTDGTEVNVPVSTYVYRKLRDLWGKHGLWDGLASMHNKHQPHRVIFAGISHGAALAQAGALQFQMTMRQAQVYVVTWNAYRWTDAIGRAVVEKELGDRILPFALSRRASTEPQATRYWDSVTMIPRRYAAMPNMLLLDADSGEILDHMEPDKPGRIGAVFLMRMFELHFAKAAIAATKKATKTWCGCLANDLAEDEDFASPMAVRIQEKILRSSQKFAEAQKEARKRGVEKLRSISSIDLVERISVQRLPRGPDQSPKPLWRRLLSCLNT